MIRNLARNAIKHAAGRFASATLPQCDYSRALFIFGHMRCGSTALSNVLCNHDDISGYGEAHITYDGPGAMGRLMINQKRRAAWKPGARYLFDKVLHSRYDEAANQDLARGRAVFMVRAPQGSVLSIRTLFAAIGSAEYATDGAAADYYEERLHTLARLWDRFDPAHRIGTTYAALTAAPDETLASVSALLALDPPLTNRYGPSGHTARPGAGDPLSSHRFTAIVASEQSTTLAKAQRRLDLADSHVARLERLYEEVGALFVAGTN